jgi:hypothetical protein
VLQFLFQYPTPVVYAEFPCKSPTSLFFSAVSKEPYPSISLQAASPCTGNHVGLSLWPVAPSIAPGYPPKCNCEEAGALVETARCGITELGT